MSEITPKAREANSARIQKLHDDIEELKRVVTALIQGMKNTEDEIGEPLMPEGIYYGHKFE